jgi:hypothetical protein
MFSVGFCCDHEPSGLVDRCSISHYAAFLGWLISAAQVKNKHPQHSFHFLLCIFRYYFVALSDFEHISSIIRIIIVIIDSSEFELLIGLFAE